MPLSWAQLEHRAVALPETAEDVMELRRLGSDLFEARKRSGDIGVGDIVMLQTLPQGVARLATLQVQERMRARKTRNAAGATSSGISSMEPAEEKPRTRQEHFVRESIDAAEHVDRTAVPSSSARPMNPWAVPYVFPVTEDEIDAYNHAIDENERQWEERERRQSETLLATLRMPEDIAIAGRRLTSKSESTNLLLMRMMKERDDAFVYDPETRAEQESQTARAEHKAKMKRIAAHKMEFC